MGAPLGVAWGLPRRPGAGGPSRALIPSLFGRWSAGGPFVGSVVALLPCPGRASRPGAGASRRAVCLGFSLGPSPRRGDRRAVGRAPRRGPSLRGSSAPCAGGVANRHIRMQGLRKCAHAPLHPCAEFAILSPREASASPAPFGGAGVQFWTADYLLYETRHNFSADALRRKKTRQPRGFAGNRHNE